MLDGLYQISYKEIYAGFIIHNGIVTKTAPILRRFLLGVRESKVLEICATHSWTITFIEMDAIDIPIEMRP